MAKQASSTKKRVAPGRNVQTHVLRLSRRRCCICFGLRRDDQPKKGQIAHLDHDRTNSKVDNLAWLCLDHHDEYDLRTSQAKGLQIDEVKGYRQELYEAFAHWGSGNGTAALLDFLASSMTLDDILNGAIKTAARYRSLPELLVLEVLTDPDFQSHDTDRWVPHLALLEDMQRWGWLTFSMISAPDSEDGFVHAVVTYKPLCEELLAKLGTRQLVPNQSLQPTASGGG
ncbi:MAG: hypothetical protein IPM02_03795 [Betaproteobacteria bacterium]|nr:hypothetical protein [Betaproteobacteria bacterium]